MRQRLDADFWSKFLHCPTAMLFRPVAVPRFKRKFKKGDQVSGLVVPNLSVESFERLENATILIACPKANHYLVATDDLQRVNCVQLNRPALHVGEDPQSASKLAQFIGQFTHAEYGFVDVWPNLEDLNGALPPRLAYVVATQSHTLVPKPRSVVRLSNPQTSLFFFVYSSRLSSKLMQTIGASKACCLLENFSSIAKIPRDPSAVYFPYAHLMDSSVKFTSLGDFSQDDMEVFSLFCVCFFLCGCIGIHDRIPQRQHEKSTCSHCGRYCSLVSSNFGVHLP